MGFKRQDVVTADGATLATFESLPPVANPPTLLLVNGLGGNLTTWRHFVAAFRDTHRIVSWDYRGLHGSTLAPGETAETADLSIETHARDAAAVVEALEVDSAVFVGWSMGVQLNFELSRTMPERIEALVQIAGSFGRSLQTTRFGRGAEGLILPAMGIFKRAVEARSTWVKRVAGSRMLMNAAKQLGLVAETIDVELARDVVADYVKLDFGVYNKILAGLGQHDAEQQLPELDVPVLIVAGDRDPMTPDWLSRKMSELIPASELVVMKGGSHYLPVEFPDKLNAVVSRFLDRRVYALDHSE